MSFSSLCNSASSQRHTKFLSRSRSLLVSCSHIFPCCYLYALTSHHAWPIFVCFFTIQYKNKFNSSTLPLFHCDSHLALTNRPEYQQNHHHHRHSRSPTQIYSVWLDIVIHRICWYTLDDLELEKNILRLAHKRRGSVCEKKAFQFMCFQLFRNSEAIRMGIFSVCRFAGTCSMWKSDKVQCKFVRNFPKCNDVLEKLGKLSNVWNSLAKLNEM